MKLLLWAAGVALLLGGICLSLPARAQFGGGAAENSPILLEKDAQTGAVRIKADPVHYGSLAIYPYAPFVTGGRLPDGMAGTTTEYGALFAGQFGVHGHVDPRSQKREVALEVGGWYWTKGSSDLYQIHARGFFNHRFGVQAGYLGSTAAKGTAYSGFLVYEIASRDQVPRGDEKFPRPRRAWNIETGLGIFYDVSNGRETSTASMYVDAAVNVGPRLSLNGTFWYVRDRSQDFNRFAIGLGYHF